MGPPPPSSLPRRPAPVAASRVPVPAPDPGRVYEDAAGITVGMGYAEVEQRFGPPALAVTTAEAKLLQYLGKDESLQVEIAAGKVSSIRTARLPVASSLK